MSAGMNIFFMIQAYLMIAFYFVAGVLLIILMVKGIQALGTYNKKAKLELKKLQDEAGTTPEVIVTLPPVADEEPTEDK